MQYQQQHQKRSESDRPTNIVPLQAPKKQRMGHRHWGALLAEVRRAARVRQKEIADAFGRYTSPSVLAKDLDLHFPQSLGEIKPITDKQYGKWERDETAPKFSQLLSLYLRGSNL